MRCHHYCNEPLRCPECVRRFWAWAQARTHSPPRKGEQVSFYACVNVVSPPVKNVAEKV